MTGTKIFAAAFAVASGLQLLAQSVPDGFGELSPWANFTALGAVVGLLVWIVVRQQPAQAKAALESQRELLVDATQTLDKMADRFEIRERLRDEAVRKLADSVNQFGLICARCQDRSDHTKSE